MQTLEYASMELNKLKKIMAIKLFDGILVTLLIYFYLGKIFTTISICHGFLSKLTSPSCTST